MQQPQAIEPQCVCTCKKCVQARPQLYTDSINDDGTWDLDWSQSSLAKMYGVHPRLKRSAPLLGSIDESADIPVMRLFK